ncbi:MAG: M28 family peptidase [Caulobacterales bacterium]|nr:M28 family peptidase [Caulobacterales bacterium]
MRRLLLAATAVLLLGASAPVDSFGERALADVRILSAEDMAGRGIETEGSARARAYIGGRFSDMGLAVVEQPFTFTRKRDGKEIDGVNLITRIEGRRPDGRVIVVTAHYDHLGTRDGVVFNGADDNASGVAGLLAVAENLGRLQPMHTVYLVALDGEESGLRGARAFVEAPPVPLARIGLNVNFDMISKSARGELYAAGGAASPWVKARLEELVRLGTGVPTLKLGHDTDADGAENNWTSQSDHGAFAAMGVTWVYFGVEDHPEYHQPTDDFATVPRHFFLQAVRTVVEAMWLFDDELDTLTKEAGR